MKGHADELDPPAGLDWPSWVRRWDLMQERHLVRRSERFAIIIQLIRATQDRIERVLDLGCGTGSLMFEVLKAFPEVQAQGVDFDPTLLWLARARLADSKDRCGIIFGDLRDPTWLESVHQPVDAVISATALHWLKPEQLTRLYGSLARMLRPGGIFLNADHVASSSPRIQRGWQAHRDQMLQAEFRTGGDDWDGFWGAYSQAIGGKSRSISDRVPGGWDGGVEDGLPLEWHFEQLSKAGFACIDCFWRCDCDAIYGGIRL